VKQALVVAVLLGVAAGDSLAQGVDVHNRLGESGSHFTLPLGIQDFMYESTIIAPGVPFQVTLEVYHNGALTFVESKAGPDSTLPFFYSTAIPMGGWRLSAGDTVTFVLRVISSATGDTLASHTLVGDVTGP
jgi:hypothetical protein